MANNMITQAAVDKLIAQLEETEWNVKELQDVLNPLTLLIQSVEQTLELTNNSVSDTDEIIIGLNENLKTVNELSAKKEAELKTIEKELEPNHLLRKLKQAIANLENEAEASIKDIQYLASQFNGPVGHTEQQRQDDKNSSERFEDNLEKAKKISKSLPAGIGGKVGAIFDEVSLALNMGDLINSAGRAYNGPIGDESYEFNIYDSLTSAGRKKARLAGISKTTHNALQNVINREILQYDDPKTKTIHPRFLADNGNELYRLINSVNNQLDPNENEGYDLLKTLIGYNNYGELNPHTNADLFAKLKELGYELGFLVPGNAREGHGKVRHPQPRQIAFPGNHTAIQSQQSSAINITIHGNFNFNTKSAAPSVSEIKKIITTVLQDAVNDSEIAY